MKSFSPSISPNYWLYIDHLLMLVYAYITNYNGRLLEKPSGELSSFYDADHLLTLKAKSANVQLPPIGSIWHQHSVLLYGKLLSWIHQ